jgi:hypothetical protein
VVNGLILDFVLRLGESALRAQDEFLDVTIDEILQNLIRVRTIDNSDLRVLTVASLRTQLSSKEFGDFTGITMQRITHVFNVGKSRLDTISRAFNLSKDCRHLVTILGIINGCRTRDVDHLSSSNRHDGNVNCLFLFKK